MFGFFYFFILFLDELDFEFELVGIGGGLQLRTPEKQAIDTSGRVSILAVEALPAARFTRISFSYIVTFHSFIHQSLYAHQLVVNGDTILSPGLTVFTFSPASTTSPVNSCPMMNPVPDGWWPLNTCSSLRFTSVSLSCTSQSAQEYKGERTYEPHRAVP